MTTQEFTPKTKATLVILNSLGIQVNRHVYLNSFKVEKNPSNLYQDRLTAYYILKGKRTTIGTRFNVRDITIALGWQGVEGNNNDVLTSAVSLVSSDMNDIIHRA